MSNVPVTSLKQIDANRRNALKSTGPITAEGKLRSRSNAIRHGLTAETVIGALEDTEDYGAFESAVTGWCRALIPLCAALQRPETVRNSVGQPAIPTS
jgi:hypothetical protein